LGTVEARDKQAAIEKGAEKFKAEAWRRYAVARRAEQHTEASMKIRPFDVKTVDECLDVLEDCFDPQCGKNSRKKKRHG
jgi:hypothetical protein